MKSTRNDAVSILGMSWFLWALSDWSGGLAWAQSASRKSEFQLEPILFNGQASFETLTQETLLPPQKVKISPQRGNTLRSIQNSILFPAQDFGYPAGTNSSALGGRTVDDTQVSTLGVPLNLPQGGGAYLSVFPSFLWSEAILLPHPGSQGFVPSSASGAIDLRLWTRDQVVASSPPRYDSRMTASYDRQIQTLSVATQRQNIAMNVGTTLGLQEGPAGSISYEFYRDSRQTYRFHLLGTDQNGVTPTEARQKTWRVIPALEWNQKIPEAGLQLQTTAFGDWSLLKFQNKTQSDYDTASRALAVGLENAILWDNTTLAVSIRFEQFRQASTVFSREAAADEFPLLLGWTQEVELSEAKKIKWTAKVQGINRVGFQPAARLSYAHHAWTWELGTLPKMPTLTQRYYRYLSFNPTDPDSFIGNPQLRPERVTTASGAHQLEFGPGSAWSLESQFKAEWRHQVQIQRGNTMINGGEATLAYLTERLKLPTLGRFDLDLSTIFTVSRLMDSQLPYPSLPAFSSMAQVRYTVSPELEISSRTQYRGPSVAAGFPSGGRFHPPYTLTDLELRFQPHSAWTLTAGVENLTDRRAEVVLDFPLPGRLFYFGTEWRL